MLKLLFLISLINNVVSDLVHEYNYSPDHYVDGNNIIASSMWALGVCSCIGVVCEYKNKLPLNIKPKDGKYYDEGIKSYLKLSLKEGQSLNKLRTDLNEMKKAIDFIEREENEKKKLEKNIETYIPHDIKYSYGTGEIRFKRDGKYYHGIIGEEDKYKFNIKAWKENYYEKCMWHYTNPNSRLPNKEWDTRDINDFCNNCTIQPSMNKYKRTCFIYKCNGHS